MTPKKILMILDDAPGVGRALSRALGRHFDEVHAFTSAAEASALLERMPVTHVICDQSLGQGDPSGLELIPSWRRSHASIERAIILTGLAESTLRPGPEIDGIVSKLVGPEELARMLKGG